MFLPYGAVTALFLYLPQPPPSIPSAPDSSSAPTSAPAETPSSEAGASTPSTSSSPSSPSGEAAAAPGSNEAVPPDEDRPARKRGTLPWQGSTDVLGRCGILTNFESSGEGCEIGMRGGATHVYYAGSLGFFNTPQFERFVRNGGRTETVIDPRSPSLYYLSSAIGFALWPTRQIGVHLELGAFGGLLYSRASTTLPTEGAVDLAVGALGMLGADYRIRSFPWAFGLDYRIQSIPYVGLTRNGEKPTGSGIAMGPTPMDVGHFFLISFVYRQENNRHD